MIKIRLSRRGFKKRAYYRIVAVDERKKRSSGLEIIGTWDPIKNLKTINKDVLDKWVSKGAITTKGVKTILES